MGLQVIRMDTFEKFNRRVVGRIFDIGLGCWGLQACLFTLIDSKSSTSGPGLTVLLLAPATN